MTDPLRAILWVTRTDLRDSETKTRALIRKAFDDLKEIIVTSTERLSAALEGISGDITGLKAKADAVQAALDAALADQSAEVEAAVAAAVAEAKAEFDASLADLVAKAEAIDAATPAVEPPAEPAVPNPSPEG